MIKIFKDIIWRGRKVVCTWHFYREGDELQRPLETLPDLLEQGAHRQIGKRKNECLTPWKGKRLCIIYASNGEVVLIHVKPK